MLLSSHLARTSAPRQASAARAASVRLIFMLELGPGWLLRVLRPCPRLSMTMTRWLSAKVGT